MCNTNVHHKLYCCRDRMKSNPDKHTELRQASVNTSANSEDLRSDLLLDTEIKPRMSHTFARNSSSVQ